MGGEIARKMGRCGVSDRDGTVWKGVYKRNPIHAAIPVKRGYSVKGRKNASK